MAASPGDSRATWTPCAHVDKTGDRRNGRQSEIDSVRRTAFSTRAPRLDALVLGESDADVFALAVQVEVGVVLPRGE